MKTINLLPKVRQQELYYENILHGVTMLIWISIVSFMVVFLVQLATKFYVQSTTNTVQNEIKTLQSQINKQDNDSLKIEITGINNTISDYKTLAASGPKWSKVVKAFIALPPSGISIGSFAVDATKLKVTISGYSPTRESVIELYNNIAQDSKEFYGIDYPLENVIKATDVNFHFSFMIRPELIK